MYLAFRQCLDVHGEAPPTCASTGKQEKGTSLILALGARTRQSSGTPRIRPSSNLQFSISPPTANDPTARAVGSESATLVGLFALDLLGVAPARIRFVAPSSADAKGAPFAAVVKGSPDERPRGFST